MLHNFYLLVFAAIIAPSLMNLTVWLFGCLGVLNLPLSSFLTQQFPSKDLASRDCAQQLFGNFWHRSIVLRNKHPQVQGIFHGQSIQL